MKIIETTQLSPSQKEAMLTLWNNEYPARISHPTIESLDSYLSTLTDPIFFLLENDNKAIEGWAIKFIRNNELWFALVIDSKVHGSGKGSFMLNKLKENETTLNGWVIDHPTDIKQNGEYYRSPMPFYLKNSFPIHPEQRFESEKMSAVKISWQSK